MWYGTGNNDSSDSDSYVYKNSLRNYLHANIISTAEYAEWVDMRERCINPHHPHYEEFGKIGAKVCNDWYLSFAKFLYDMGEMPTSSPKKLNSPTLNANKKYAYVLERMDATQPYCKENCRWTLRSDNVLHFKFQKTSSKIIPLPSSSSSSLPTNEQKTNKCKFDLLETVVNTPTNSPKTELESNKKANSPKSTCKMS